MEYVNLDQIADILNGYNFKSANYVTDGIRVIRITNVQQGYLEDKDPVFYDYSKDLDRYLLKEKDLLMSLTGNVGRVGMVVSSLLPAGLNQRVACIRCKNESFNIEFLFYFFNNELFRKKAISNSNGVAQLNLSTEWLKKVKVPVYDGEKQQKIVEEFDNITFLINENKNILVNLDNIVKSQFIEMIKKSTERNVLNDFVFKCKIAKCVDENLPPLSITKEDGFVLQEEKFKKRIASKDVSSYKVIPYGKLVMGLHIDEGAFAIQNIVPYGIVSPAYKAWDVRGDKVIPELLQYCLRSDEAINYFRSKFKGATVERRNPISENDLMNTPLNLPCLDKQKQFYQVMQLIDKSKYII